MLVLTPAASQAVEAIVSQMGPGDNAGLRISAAERRDDGSAPSGDLQLSVVSEPEPEDALIEGAPIYVEPTTVAFLEDKVLDAEVGEQQVRFSLYEQPNE
jgi:Fe-S cluster assembly iron-binding protein IscA